MTSFKNFINERSVIGKRPSYSGTTTIKEYCNSALSAAEELKTYLDKSVTDEEWDAEYKKSGLDTSSQIRKDLEHFHESIKQISYQGERLRKGISRVLEYDRQGKIYPGKERNYTRQEVIQYIEDVIKTIG